MPFGGRQGKQQPFTVIGQGLASKNFLSILKTEIRKFMLFLCISVHGSNN